ncbi:MAG TPA: nitroreductase family protein [Coriobacteriia bacterium]|nr:nitroreductase family protein [Coriobacteriia bacterium]
MNPTLEMLAARCSTRAYSDTPITAAERDAILSATFRAPTGGNMMLYSIIEVEDPELKARLAVTCDDQPFIATAPWVLVFLADFQKWTDLFDAAGVENRRTPGPGDLLLACSDALIAAQNAVVAAESLGIGSCYIGDVLENGEEHAALFDLPPHTLPIAMLCFGRAASKRAPAPRYTKHVVHRDRYRQLSAEELAQTARELQETHAPHGLAPGVASYPVSIHDRKYASDFMAEMNRSVAWWLERWQGRA